jgi:hypothetical protein
MQSRFLFGRGGFEMKADNSKNKNDLPIDKPEYLEAINDCLKHAEEHFGMTTKDIAQTMNVNMWTLFKWLESGKLPLNEINKFEAACHARYITRYLADASGLILVTKPRNMEAPENALVAINKASSNAISAIAEYIGGTKNKQGTTKAIDAAIEVLVWQRSRLNDG